MCTQFMKLDCRLYRVLHYLEVGARSSISCVCIVHTYVHTHTWVHFIVWM